VIEIKPSQVVPIKTYQGGLGYTFTHAGPYTYMRSHKTPYSTPRDLFIARTEILDWLKEHDPSGTIDPADYLKEIATSYPFMMEIIENLYRNDVSVEELRDYMIAEEQKEVEREAADEAKAKEKGKEIDRTGIPDYYGYLRDSEM
jgi:hypothetical protein